MNFNISVAYLALVVIAPAWGESWDEEAGSRRPWFCLIDTADVNASLKETWMRERPREINAFAPPQGKL